MKVFDGVAVALFSQKELALHGEFLFAGVVADDGVEVGLVIAGFGAEDAAEALSFFLA